MLKVYYCPSCRKVFYLQFETNTECRSCGADMVKSRISFNHFTSMSPVRRRVELRNEFQSSEYFKSKYKEDDFI